MVNAKLSSLVTTYAKTPAKDALWLRKKAAAKQRASLVEQMRALKTEEDCISSFDEGSNFMVPGQSENQGPSPVTPADAEYWSGSVLQDAAMILVKSDSEQVFLANRDRGGLPLAALNVDDDALHNKNPPTPCLWQAPASTQKTKKKKKQAGHSPERTVGGRTAAPNAGSSRLIAMYDTGCSPSGLIQKEKLEELRQPPT